MPTIKKFSIRKIVSATLVTIASFSASSANAESAQTIAVLPTITTATPEFVYTYLLGEIAGQRGM